jgi:hypothetical protein
MDDDAGGIDDAAQGRAGEGGQGAGGLLFDGLGVGRLAIENAEAGAFEGAADLCDDERARELRGGGREAVEDLVDRGECPEQIGVGHELIVLGAGSACPERLPQDLVRRKTAAHPAKRPLRVAWLRSTSR